MDKGIAISTYIGKDTNKNRTNIFLASVHSLLASGFDGKIVVVDDASVTNDHLNALYDITDRIKYIKRTENVGIAQCKNECVKALSDCQYLFLADDDMLYNGNWWDVYINAHKKTGIEHFCYHVPQIYHKPPAQIVEYKGVKLTKYDECNGCLLFLTSGLVATMGAFKISNRVGWFEHPHFTQRCVAAGKAPFRCDVYGSRNHLRLNRSSYDCTSSGKSSVIVTPDPIPQPTEVTQKPPEKPAEPIQIRAVITKQYNDLYLTTEYDHPVTTWNKQKWGALWNALCKIKNRQSIIDFGCGRGYYLRILKSIGHDVFGVEQSQACCDKYLKDIPHNCSTVQDFLAQSNVRDGWNVTMSTDFFEHLPEEDVEGTIKAMSVLAKSAIHGITNSSDKNQAGEELHLTQKNQDWWIAMFKKHYQSVEIAPDPVGYPTPYFLLLCRR